MDHASGSRGRRADGPPPGPARGRRGLLVYLLPFGRPLHHAPHDLGFCGPGQRDARLADPQAGRGAKLLAAGNRAAIAYHVVRTGPTGDRHLERRWKRGKNARRRLCPVCRGTAGQ